MKVLLTILAILCSTLLFSQKGGSTAQGKETFNTASKNKKHQKLAGSFTAREKKKSNIKTADTFKGGSDRKKSSNQKDFFTASNDKHKHKKQEDFFKASSGKRSVVTKDSFTSVSKKKKHKKMNEDFFKDGNTASRGQNKGMGKETRKQKKSKDSFGVNPKKLAKKKQKMLNSEPEMGLPEYMLPNK